MKILLNSNQNDSEGEQLYLKLMEFRKSEIFVKYEFDEEDVTKIKIDINLMENFVNTNEILKWVKDQLKQSPEIKPIIQVLKRYLQNKKLNSSFDGKNYFKKI